MGKPRPPFPIPRLASRFEDLDAHYDAVVVGSGYGGGIAAARLAAAGKRVCLLERGKEIQPGEYPSNLGEAGGDFRVRFNGHKIWGSETSLFDFQDGDGIGTIVGCGLGGGSLINANVALEAEPWVFQAEEWPAELMHDEAAALRAGLERARRMLQATPFPDDSFGLHKLRALELEAEGLKDEGARFYLPPLTVNFETGRNRAGIDQVECRNCGDCVSGCNYGAKNTVLMNYLPYARRFGAEIFTEIRVDYLERAEAGGWRVRFRRVGAGADIFDGPHRFLAADLVVLGAGTLGSTEILLRSRQRGLDLSDEVGRRFSGNGDTVAFAYDSDLVVNGIGLGEEPLEEHPPVGPCIAGIVDLREGQGERGFLIEDGSTPGAIAKGVPGLLALLSPAASPPPAPPDSEEPEPPDEALPTLGRGSPGGLWRRLLSLPARPYQGAALNTQTHLVMSHDGAGGTLRLSDDGERLEIAYPGVGDETTLRRIDRLLYRASRAIGAQHIPSPVWDKLWIRPLRRFWYRLLGRYRPKKPGGRDLVTVHPLGGCAMGEDASSGVVNERQQVFRGRKGRDVYDNLYVMDGAVMPRSLGVNPFLTISGLAERACEKLLADHYELELTDEDPRAPFPEEAYRPRTLGIRFAEKMSGHVLPGEAPPPPESYRQEREGYEAAEQAAKQLPGTELGVILDMEIDDVDRLMETPEHWVRVSGIAESPLFDGAAMVVKGSWARIMTPSDDRVNTRTMMYRVNAMTKDGRRFRISGDKLVSDHVFAFWRLWPETTVLYTKVYQVPDGLDFDAVEGDDAAEVARGIIRIKPIGFLKQLFTQKAVNPRSWMEKQSVLWRFRSWFSWTVFQNASPLLYPANRVERDAVPVPLRPPRAPGGEAVQAVVHDLEADDGVGIRLTNYRAGSLGPVIVAHGLGVSSRIFSTPTLEENLLDHLCKQGYDVWLLDYRASTDLPGSSHTQFSGDDIARYDHPKAVEFVLRETGAKDVQMVVHCFGATTFFMAMLGGHVPKERIRSVVVSQIATHMITSVATRVKAGFRAGNLLWWLLGWRFPTVYSDDAARPWDRLANFALRFWPMAPAERCRSDVCHRISFIYSLLYEHEQLDPETHDALHDMFGVANMKALRHLAVMSRKGRLVTWDGEDAYIPQMDENLPFPIRFLHGSRNACFLPVSTRITCQLLQELHEKDPAKNPGPYDRFEIPRFGHIDCIFGRNAKDAVYPLISEHLRGHHG